MKWQVAFLICIVAAWIADSVSAKTKAKIPALFALSTIFLLGYWTFFLKDIVTLSKFGAVSDIAILMILIQVGTLFDFKSLIKDWKVAALTMACIVTLTIVVFAVGTPLFGWNTAVTAVPPIAGGGMAALIMSQANQARGYADLAVMSMLIFIMQGFLGFPLTSMQLKKEASRVLDLRKQGKYVPSQHAAEANHDAVAKPILIERLVPKKYRTSTFYIFECGAFGVLAWWLALYTAPATGNIINSAILSILIGMAASSCGLIERDALGKAGAYTFLMGAMQIYFMNFLATVTPAGLIKILIPLAGLLAISCVAIWLICRILAPKFGFSKYLGFAIGLNCYLGYPYNHLLTDEACTAIAGNPEEKQFLMGELLPPMIIGSVTAVTVVSTLMAGFFAGFLK